MWAYLRTQFEKGTQITEFNVSNLIKVGIGAHTFFYFLFKYGFDLAENGYFRALAVAIGVTYIFLDRFPRALRRNMKLYWHSSLIIMLPFIFIYNLLITDFHELWRYWSIFMVFVLILYVPNLLAMLLDLLIGTGLAILAFLFTSDVHLNPDFNIALYAIVVAFSIFAGYLFSVSNLKGTIAQERNQTLTALAASIAHETRTPISQLSHSLDSIEHSLPSFRPRQDPEPLTEAQLAQLYRLTAQGRLAAQRGSQVVEMILREVRNEPVDPRAFVLLSAQRVTTKALDEYRYEEGQRETVRLRLEGDFTFRGDETLLVFVLFNLLKNALYYQSSYPDTEVLVTVCANNRLLFRDTGPGIEQDALVHLFDDFYSHNKPSGTGLGLAYCRRVMRAFGGDISCRSQLGEFTEFSLDFPAVDAAQQQAYMQDLLTQVRPLFQNRRILVVDDEPEQRARVRAHLAPLNVQVDEAEDGQQALAAVEAASRGVGEDMYALMLLDLNMPVMDGYQTADILSKRPVDDPARRIRIVAHTTEPGFLVSAKVARVGMQGLINKPCEQQEFIRVLGNIMATPNPVESAPEGESGRYRVLLVDDDSISRSSAQLALEHYGWEVITASHGEQALEKLAHIHCDAVLTDLNMPGMAGYELAQTILDSTDARVTNTPVIAWSSQVGEADRQRARKAGMQGLVDKVGGLTEIDALLRSLLSGVPAQADATKQANARQNKQPAKAQAYETPAIDMVSAVQQWGHQAGLLEERLDHLQGRFREHQALLQALFEHQEWQTLQALAHKIAGAASVSSAPEVAVTARQLEQALAELPPKPCSPPRAQLEQLTQALGRVDAFLKQRVATRKH